MLALGSALPGFPAWTQTNVADASLLTYESPDRSERLLAAARKDATLTWYTSFAEKDIPVVVDPFEKKYGIKIRAWRASTERVLQRLLAETSAGRYDVDAIHISSAGAVPAHREWVATLLSVWVQAYNTGALRKEDLPKSYRDLLAPRFKGKLGIEVEDAEWFATVALSMGEEQGLRFFQELVAKNGISVRKGHTLLTNLVVSGEVPFALTVYNYMAEQAKRRGAPIDWIALDPAVGRSNGMGIARHARHPNAALLFYDFFISEAQPLLVGLDYVPTNRTVVSPLKDLPVKLVDAAQVLEQGKKWEKAFQDIVVKRSGG